MPTTAAASKTVCAVVITASASEAGEAIRAPGAIAAAARNNLDVYFCIATSSYTAA